MSKTLVIVESPTKARTITKFLGKGYEVKASFGHVRDLPNSASEIPKEQKKEEWTRLGVNVDKDFEPLYIIPEEKAQHVRELKKSVKDATELLLATDEDREGESISWHLLQVLNPKIPVKRLVFHEITKEAIDEALKTARDIDENLVKAQETRRIVDRLYGYLVSPVLWKKMARGLSAGRVQSVAMKLLVARERERMRFRSAHYWDLKARFAKGREEFDAELTHLNGKRVAGGKDFDPETGRLNTKDDVVLIDQARAEKLHQAWANGKAFVSSVEEKPYTSRPSGPFTTSTMQQEASRKLGFAVKRTMSVAQLLYENGFITYMRTDSVTLSEEALTGARRFILSEFGKEYLPDAPRVYKNTVKNAQEAHEAIRPAGQNFTQPGAVRERLGEEAFRLYELIWKRTLASQMKDSHGMRIAVNVELGEGLFRASGKTIEFAGFLRAYVEGSDDPQADIADQEVVLPAVKVGEQLGIAKLEALDHETQPPPRFTEASLIKELERLGIGRPSTWASIVDVILSRNYAFKRGTALVPSFTATAVTDLMEKYFTQLLEIQFTARLEDDLDAISRGEADSLKYLSTFYFGNGLPGLRDLVKNGEEKIDPREVCGLTLGKDKSGRHIEVRIGRFGPFISNGEQRASVPDAVAPDEMTVEMAEQLLVEAAKGPASLGVHPQTSQQVYLKKGRFGPYLQLGEMVEGGDKPKMASLLPGMKPEDVSLEIALKLLAFPLSLGKHAELNEDVMVYLGRYGPYIKCGSESRSIPLDQMSPLDITMAQAAELLKQPKRRGASSKPQKLKELGKHPTKDLVISMFSGRYGPYVTDGETNASLPREVKPEDLTLEQALNLIEAREGKGKKKRGKKAPAAKKAKATKKAKPAAESQ